MIAILDIGNSSIKVCTVDSGGMPADVVTASVESSENLQDLPPLQGASHVIVACSGDQTLANELIARLNSAGVSTFEVDCEGPVPYASGYAAGQAGIDRLANVAAAISDVGFPAIIVDAGSAITLEVIGTEGTFLGGAIFPGLRLQAMALHKGTATLPDVTINAATPIIGPDTTAAIRSGILYGCLGAVDRLVRLTLDEPGMASAIVVFTGGDGQLISDSLNFPAAVTAPELTLRGLYLLARHQHPGQLQ